MGRSRAVYYSVDDDANQRSKRKKVSSSGDVETEAFIAQPRNEVKRASYHCNYCNKDLSGMIRIKCAVCPDFDLCVECFSVGAELTPHKSNHPYRVMDNLSFPLLCPDWNADEELLLVEGLETYGFGNWREVAEHVGTKTKSQCIEHYKFVYLNSLCFPLPDLSHVMGKSREELLAIAKEWEIKKATEFPVLCDLTLKEDSSSSAKDKYEAPRKEDPVHQSSSSLAGDVGSPMASSSGNGNTCSDAVKKASNMVQIKDDVKVEEQQAERRIGEKKPRMAGHEEPSMTELSGFNSKRQEFEVEYDNDAEQLLADMEFRETDTDAERGLKLQVLRIYSKRLDERKRRKDFILERTLLHSDPSEKNLSPEEKQIYQHYKVFMRYQSKEEHENLVKTVIEEHRIMRRIQDLQEARAAGCRTAAEANKFIEEKRKKEAEESARRLKESAQAGPSGKGLQRPNHLKVEAECNHRGSVKGFQPFGSESSLSSAGQSMSSTLGDWDINGFPGADLLSETEKQLCGEIRILPSHYLTMLQTISREILKGKITKNSDAYCLFKVEPMKVDRVYDMVVKKGIAQA